MGLSAAFFALYCLYIGIQPLVYLPRQSYIITHAENVYLGLAHGSLYLSPTENPELLTLLRKTRRFGQPIPTTPPDASFTVRKYTMRYRWYEPVLEWRDRANENVQMSRRILPGGIVPGDYAYWSAAGCIASETESCIVSPELRERLNRKIAEASRRSIAEEQQREQERAKRQAEEYARQEAYHRAHPNSPMIFPVRPGN
jgi:hypothetical protein